MTTVKTKFTGSPADIYSHQDKIALERGFNPSYKYMCSEVWPSFSQPGVTVYASFYYCYEGDVQVKLHVITENDLDSVPGKF